MLQTTVMTRLIIEPKNLRFQSLRVKLLSLVIVAILGFAHNVCADPQPTDKYGEFIIQYALLWLPEYLRQTYEQTDPFLEEMARIASEIRKVSITENPIPKPNFYEFYYTWRSGSLVKFLPESSGEFKIPGSPTNRVAVTGDAMDSEILFNLDKISDRTQFSYEDALALWVHEIGHKYKAKRNLTADERINVQAKIDNLASALAKNYSRHAVVESGPLLAFNGSIYGHWERRSSLIVGYYESRLPNRLFYAQGNDLIDLSHVLNRELDRFGPRVNSFQTMRRIREIQIWKTEGDVIYARIRYFVNTRPLDPYKVHSNTDTSSHLPFYADVIVRDGSIKVWRCHPDEPDLKRAEDAELELPYFEVKEDGTFRAEFHLTVSTNRYFHSSGFPASSNDKLLFLMNGNVVQVPIQMHMNLEDQSWSKMPAEAYQTTMLKRARVGGKLPDGWRDGFQVIGYLGRFFDLHYRTGEAQPLAVSMKNRLRAKAGCEGELRREPGLKLTPRLRGYEFYGYPFYLD